jgi:hypothetical protein
MKHILKYRDFVNENTGAIPVFISGDYKITINKELEPTHLVLFYQDKKVGVLNCYVNETRFEFCGNKPYKFYHVSYVEINKEHRNKGYGKKLYQILEEYRGDVKGLISSLPDRVNKNQIPKIYKNFKTIFEDDNHIIVYDNSIITSEKKPIKIIKEKNYYYSYNNVDKISSKGIWITSKPSKLNTVKIYNIPKNLNILDVNKGRRDFKNLLQEFNNNNTTDLKEVLTDSFIDFLISKSYDGLKDFDEVFIFDKNVIKTVE